MLTSCAFPQQNLLLQNTHLKQIACIFFPLVMAAFAKLGETLRNFYSQRVKSHESERYHYNIADTFVQISKAKIVLHPQRSVFPSCECMYSANHSHHCILLHCSMTGERIFHSQNSSDLISVLISQFRQCHLIEVNHGKIIKKQV